MSNLNDFRISSWKSEGLLTRAVASVEREWRVKADVARHLALAMTLGTAIAVTPFASNQTVLNGWTSALQTVEVAQQAGTASPAEMRFHATHDRLVARLDQMRQGMHPALPDFLANWDEGAADNVS